MSAPGSPDFKVIDGPHRLEAWGTVTIISHGEGTYISSQGEEGLLSLTAESTAALVAGPAGVILSNEEVGMGVVNITPGDLGTLKMFAGPLDLGSLIEMTPEYVKISVGPPELGTSITMTDESITLAVAEVTMTLTAEGITEDVAEVSREVTPEGHNFTAGETELNVGVEGLVAEVPTSEEEVDGGTVVNETLASQSTDAAKEEDAGIIITE